VARGFRTHTQRTTLELDVDELRRAKHNLGTRTTRDTVNQALHEVNRLHALRRAADLIRAGGLNLVQPEDLEDLRRPRFTEPS
jgi:predicted O-methyltransferase YrrM